MTFRSLIFVVILGSQGLALAASLPGCFLGRWRSNEELTLADMRQHPEVSPLAKELFERQFFGRLVIVFSKSFWGGYLDPDQGRDDVVFVPIDVVSATETTAVLRSTTLGVVQENEFHCDSGRLWVLVSRWKFREYFLRE